MLMAASRRIDWAFLIAWHALVVLAMLVVVSLFAYGAPFWALPRRSPQFDLAVVAMSYAAVAITLVVVRVRGGCAVCWVVPAAFGSFGLLALGFLLGGRQLSVEVLAAGLGASVVLAPLGLMVTRTRWIAVPVLALGLGGTWAVQADRAAQPTTTARLVTSATADLDLLTYRGKLKKPFATGGAVVSLDDGFLVVDGDGRFSAVTWSAGNDLVATPLALRAPLNVKEFDQDAMPRAGREHFRVADLIVQEVEGGRRVLVSHHHWNRDRKCFVVRVSEAMVHGAPASWSDAPWRTVFDTRPCLSLSEGVKAVPFAGWVMGSAMVLTDSEHVLLALGDHEHDGVNHAPALAQDPSADYGKTVLIDLRTGRSEHFSSGHRNPQGIAVDAAGTVWLAEHAPMGGDELNRIERGANYGWPLVTFGRQYGGSPWPGTKTPDEHPGFHLPAYAWVPSIGPSGMVVITSDGVPGWKGDLLLASLVNQSLWRVRVRDEKVMFTEPIRIGHRVRDLAEGAGGRVLLWTDEGTVTTVQASRRMAEGARAFGQCAECHPIADGKSHGMGPDLAGIYERNIAGVPGYDFSPALRKVRGKWTEETLAEFLRDPEAMAPGNSMAFTGVTNEQELSALVAYLLRH